MAPWWLRASDDEAPLDEEVTSTDRGPAASGNDGPIDPASDTQTRGAEALPETTVPAWKIRTRGDEDMESEEKKAPTDGATPAAPPDGEEASSEAPKRRRRRRRKRRGTAAETESIIQQRAPEEPPSPPADVENTPSQTPPIVTRPLEATSSLHPAKEPALDRNIVIPLLPERSMVQDERKIAVFCDFENIALGVRDSEIKKLDINLVLARLLEKGKIIVKKAYADWERYSDYKRPFHEAAIELIDIPQKYYSGKNSADIKLVVDAMDLCYSKEHLDTFVIVSGDSDFSPLVSKLKENNKYVIGIGVKNSSSSLLTDNCDEFIYYEDVWRSSQQRPRLDNLSPKEAEAFGLMADAMLALIRENKEVLWGSMIKQTMQRKRPSFNESTYGYATFSELLEDAARKNIIGVRKDQRSGNYVVTGFVPNP